MLYQRWLDVARRQPSHMALMEVTTGESWSFDELVRLGELAGPKAGDSQATLAYPCGVTAEFVVTVLRAWKEGRVVCPLDVPATAAGPAVAELPASCCHLKRTSASSGAPRWVVFNEAQLVADAANVVSTMGLRPEWPNLGVISLAHSYGFSNLVLPLLLHGIPLHLCGSPWPESVRQAARGAERITLPAVPALWRGWHDAGAIPANISLAISAGAPLPLELEQAVFRSDRLKIHNFYGSTESGGIAYDATDTPRFNAACVGSPLRGVDVSIGAGGCLEVHSAAVGCTYWPEGSPTLSEGRYLSEDLAELRGHDVYLLGREGDQINVAGRKVSPDAVEWCLRRHAGVRECLVFGVPSDEPGRGEAIVACVVPNPGVSSTPLRDFLLRELPPWQIPRFWMLVDKLDCNARGKLSRHEWRQKFLLDRNGNRAV